METVSVPELYEMIYPVKPPIIDSFLYNGTYLFADSPKVGKSFMMAQSWDLDKVIDDKFKAPPEPLIEKIARLVNEHNPTWQGTAT